MVSNTEVQNADIISIFKACRQHAHQIVHYWQDYIKKGDMKLTSMPIVE